MSFARLHKIVTYALAGLGLASLCLGGELSPPAIVVVGTLAVLSWWAEPPRIEAPRWVLAWNVTLVGLFVVQVLRGLLGEPLLPLALEATAALQISRLANRRRAIEHQQIAILAFLHLCAATVLSTELTYGVLFVGFVVLAPWMLALTHLRSEIEGHFAPPGAPPMEREATLARVLASRRLVGAPFLLGTAALAVPLFVTTALFFALFPRVGLGFLAFGAGHGAHVAGFGADVSLGEVGILRDDPMVVARIVPPPEIAAHAPRELALLFRGTSFDAYDGRRWSRTHGGGEPLRRYGEEFLLTRTVNVARDHPWHVALEHLDQSVVFLPPRAVAVDVPSRFSVGVDLGRALTLSPGLDLRYDDPDALGLRYVVWTTDAPPTPEPLGADDLRRYLALPPRHEALAPIARAWTEGATSDRDRIERIVSRLSAAPFAYSRVMQDAGTVPPLVFFLERSHSGHCEYFASAMAILLREVGVPTRLVTGFSNAHYNGYGGYWTVRSGDAHSWVEAYVGDEGWVSFDPTPSSVEETSSFESVLAELRALTDAVRARWAEWIVGYDLRAQRDAARAIGRWLEGDRASASRGLSADTEHGVPWRALAVLAVLLVLAVLADRAYRALLRGRRRAPAPLDADAKEIVAIYRALERELVRLGLPRPSNVTPLEHASALAASNAAVARTVTLVTRRYVTARYGGQHATSGELDELRAHVRSLRAIERAR